MQLPCVTVRLVLLAPSMTHGPAYSDATTRAFSAKGLHFSAFHYSVSTQPNCARKRSLARCADIGRSQCNSLILDNTAFADAGSNKPFLIPSKILLSKRSDDSGLFRYYSHACALTQQLRTYSTARVALCLRKSACITEKHARNRSLRANKRALGSQQAEGLSLWLIAYLSSVHKMLQIFLTAAAVVGLLFVDEGI